MIRKIIAFTLSLSLTAVSFGGCGNGTWEESVNSSSGAESVSSMRLSNEETSSAEQSMIADDVSSNTIQKSSSAPNVPIKYQITEDSFIEPVPVTKPGDRMNDKEIDKMARNLFKQSSKLFKCWFYPFDDSTSLSFQEDRQKENGWAYIKSVSNYQKVFESVISKKYYAEIVSEVPQKAFEHQNGKLVFKDVHDSLFYSFAEWIPDKIRVVSKASDRITVKVKLKYAYGNNNGDGWVTDFYFTFLNQDGNWVLENYLGGIPFDLSNEPPIKEDYRDEFVPDFLDQEQRELYLHAVNFYNLFGGDFYMIDKFYPQFSGFTYKGSPDYITLDGRKYVISHGRYQDYKDFETVALLLFTPDFYKAYNYENGKPFRFRNYKGKLCYIEAKNGALLGSLTNKTFKLVKKTDNEIHFNINCHYFGLDEKERSFPITMVRTKDGWRFSEFYNAVKPPITIK